MWVLTGYQQLPFPGGWAQQPKWVRRDFTTYLNILHWQRWNAKLPDISGLPLAENG